MCVVVTLFLTTTAMDKRERGKFFILKILTETKPGNTNKIPFHFTLIKFSLILNFN